MNWIKIAVGITRDPSIIALSQALGVSVPSTTGHVVGVLTALPEGARTGDLSTVSDETIELWAMWRGKRGRFAQYFRAQLCTAQGIVRSWEKHNGAAIREADATKDRAKRWREERKANAVRNENERRTNGVANGNRTVLRDGTGRDELLTTTELPSRVAVAPRPKGGPRASRSAPAFPHFPASVCDAAYEAWQSKAGAVPYARFRKAFAPLFTAPEPDRPAAYPRDVELAPAVGLYLDATFGARDAAFRSPERCASALSGLVDVMRTTTDGERRLDGAQMVIGVRRIA